MLPLLLPMIWSPFTRKKKGNVLIWTANSISGPSFSELSTHYQGMGLTVHTQINWSGILNDYGLIFRPIADSDPTWWGEITGATWVGRIHITAEAGLFPTSIAYVDGLSAMTGINIISDGLDAGANEGPTEPDDLTAGQSTIQYALTSQTSGGTVLSRTVTGSHPWLARNKVGNIDFVISGDSNHISNSFGAVTFNAGFLQNLWNVP